MRTLITGIVTASLLWGFAGAAPAQDRRSADAFLQFPDPQFPSGFGAAEKNQQEAPIKLSARFETQREGDRGRVSVTAKLGSRWHVYSVTQPEGGPTATKLTLAGPEGVSLVGPFVPDHEPMRSTSEIWPGLRIEEHEKSVTWTAPLRFAEAIDPSKPLRVKVTGLTCQSDGSCVPFDQTVTARHEGWYEPDEAIGRFRDEDSVVEWRGELVPATAAPGEVIQLRLTARPDAGYHVYAAATDDAESATNLVLTSKAGLRAGQPQASSEVIEKVLAEGIPAVRYHEGVVTWSIPLRVPESAVAGEYPLRGMVGYQACTDTSCLRPRALQFSGTVEVGPELAQETRPLAFASAKRPEVMDAAAETRWVDDESAAKKGNAAVPAGASTPLALILLMGLGGGLILNLMPCVLPVVGLKLMAFVNQAGHDRRSILTLNLWYSLGMLSIFWLLAVLAILVRLYTGDTFSWGEQFTFFEFRLAVTLLVFALALSFLGVWEIPIPGFAAGKASQELQHKEGPAGAFFKGIFTTILATPCSGPLLGAVFAFTLAAPAPVILLVFSSVGVGMALPYLVIGAFPRLVRRLPKPGEWMETLKQLMGFVLLGTVAFLFGGFSDDHRLPVFVALIGVWFGCWIIGRVPMWAALQRRMAAWGSGLAAATLVGIMAFSWLVPGEPVMAWEPYNAARLGQLQREGRTVLVDFTAKWCVNCIVNYNRAINTETTAQLVKELDAVVMLADWTDRSEEIKRKLEELESNSIPVLAIYPGRSPEAPIVLRDLVSQREVLDALEAAGPSMPHSGRSVVAATAPRSNR